jgi:hypothetical protein
VKNNWMVHIPTALICLVALLGAAGSWFWLAHWDRVAVLLGAAALALTAFLGIICLARARAARRFNAALDAYADQELDRQRRKNGPWKRGVVSTRGGGLAARFMTGGDRRVEAKEHFPPRQRPSRQPVPTGGEGR